jgi:hypothetical protein
VAEALHMYRLDADTRTAIALASCAETLA